MRALVAADAHIFQLPDGTCWCKSVYSYSFWERYLSVFDEIRVVTRVKHIDKLDGKYLRADGPRVEIYGIPFYQGPFQLMKRYVSIQIALKKVFDGCQCAIFRMPSQTAEMTLRYKPADMPYVGEIVYCPMDDLKRDSFGVIKILDYITSERLKRFCKSANGVSYVTQSSIQNYYPSYAKLNGTDKTHFESYYSSISLEDSYFSSPRELFGSPLRVILTNDAMNSDRKGEIIALKALKLVLDTGRKAELILVGDGTKRNDFENETEKMGISRYVTFTGRLPSSKEVGDCLRRADVYILPTTGEGLPRGIIEAMALGMPVLSTPVGGIPEIVKTDCLFSPYDSEGFATKLCQMIDSPETMCQMSKENYEKALEFRNDVLQKRRNEFYGALKDIVGE